jgi:hypothetical protein
MAETQREPVPFVDTGELDTALAFLAFARHCVIKKTEGLTEEQLRRVLVPSGTSLLGLVQHLTTAERYWFGTDLLAPRPDREWDMSMDVPAGRTAAEVVDDYRQAIADSDAAIRKVGDPAAIVERAAGPDRKTLRFVLTHMTSEVARHAGHADILREQIDGTTGR